MAKVTFVLREPKSTTETPIILILRIGNKRSKIATDERINPKYWDTKNYKAKSTSKFPRYPEFNHHLKNLKTKILDVHRKLSNDGNNPSPKEVKAYYEAMQSGEAEEAEQMGFWEFIELFIQASGTKRSKGTFKSYKTTFRTLKEFEKYSKEQISFDGITLEWYDDYIKYLTKVCDYAPNTIAKRIANLKTILVEATERGYNTNEAFRSKGFKKVTAKSTQIYLTEKELQIILEIDLSNKPYLDRARDLFLVGCWTGLRFSDFSQIKKENIKDRVISIKTQKTGEVVVIPIHSTVAKIMEKYKGKTDNSLPRSISQQKLNEYIKEVGKLAEINEETLISKIKGGKRIDTIHEKWQLITTHTARRSFATNAYLNDVPSISIMKITGHKTERAFLTYIKITAEENAEKLLNHPFFQ